MERGCKLDKKREREEEKTNGRIKIIVGKIHFRQASRWKHVNRARNTNTTKTTFQCMSILSASQRKPYGFGWIIVFGFVVSCSRTCLIVCFFSGFCVSISWEFCANNIIDSSRYTFCSARVALVKHHQTIANGNTDRMACLLLIFRISSCQKHNIYMVGEIRI